MIDIDKETKVILGHLNIYFKKRSNTIYQLIVVRNPYDRSFNFFISIKKKTDRQRSIPLHSTPSLDLEDLETIVAKIQKKTHITIIYSGFTGLKWPSSQRLIEYRPQPNEEEVTTKFSIHQAYTPSHRVDVAESSKQVVVGKPQTSFSDQDVQHFFDQVYHDRGLVKWQGYFLSDHTSAIKKEHVSTQLKEHIEIEQQTSEEIKNLLSTAFKTQSPVVVYLNLVSEATNQYEFLTGNVNNLNEEICQIENERIELQQIRSIQVSPESSA